MGGSRLRTLGRRGPTPLTFGTSLLLEWDPLSSGSGSVISGIDTPCLGQDTTQPICGHVGSVGTAHLSGAVLGRLLKQQEERQTIIREA